MGARSGGGGGSRGGAATSKAQSASAMRIANQQGKVSRLEMQQHSQNIKAYSAKPGSATAQNYKTKAALTERKLKTERYKLQQMMDAHHAKFG